MTTGIAIRPSHCSRWDKTGRRCASSKHFPRQPRVSIFERSPARGWAARQRDGDTSSKPAADRSQRTRLPAGASGTAGSEGHSSSPDVVRPALLPQARPRSAGCAEHRPEPLLQGRLRGLPQRIDSRAVAARSTLRGCGNGGRRSSFPPRRTTCRFCSKRVRRYNTSCACTMLLFVGK